MLGSIRQACKAPTHARACPPRLEAAAPQQRLLCWAADRLDLLAIGLCLRCAVSEVDLGFSRMALSLRCTCRAERASWLASLALSEPHGLGMGWLIDHTWQTKALKDYT